MRLISQSIKDISFKKLLNYFNGTAKLTCFVLPPVAFFPVLFTLDFDNSESMKLAFVSSL